MKFSLKNKTLEALLRGYVLFDVNGKRFGRYNSALAFKESVIDQTPILEFKGWHIFKGWRMFYFKWECK